jgi:hypothetical protein
MLLAKKAAAHLLDNCLSEGRSDDAERVNWPSVVAAIRKHVIDWQREYELATIAAPRVIQ